MPNLLSSPLQTFQSQCLPTEAPHPLLGYLPTGLTRRPAKPRTPPADSSVAPFPPATPSENAMPPPAPAPANQRPKPAAPRQAQSRTRSLSHHKKPPCDPASPLFKSLQDGSHLPAHRRIQRMPGEEGKSSLIRQPSAGRPPQWAQPVS